MQVSHMGFFSFQLAFRELSWTSSLLLASSSIGAGAEEDLTWKQELYEPLWDELLKRCKQYGFSIRGIWIADVVHQGWSGAINEDKLGNDRMETAPS